MHRRSLLLLGIVSVSVELARTTSSLSTSVTTVTFSTPPAVVGTSNHTRQPNCGPTTVEGPSEPAITQLSNGNLMIVFREQGVSPRPLWAAFSDDSAVSWSVPAQTPAWAVWPQLITLSNGVVVLSSGRPGIGLWVLPDDGNVTQPWAYYNIATVHNRLVASNPTLPVSWQYDSVMDNIVNASSPGYGPNGPETTSYTGMAEVEPNVVLL
eukprot:gene11178-27960_t